MEAKHTSGPWAVRTNINHNHFIHADSRPNDPVAGVRGFNDEISPDEGLANARLIAAAPDLLNALVVLANAAESKGIPVDAARAAINKALDARQ